MRNAMHPFLTTTIFSNLPSAPAFPVAMLGLQRADIVGDRRRRRSHDTSEVWQMAALWSDDRTSCDAALWSDEKTSCDAALWSDDLRSCDAALWADRWPIAN